MGWKQYFVYMMTNRWKNVLYTGMTNSLEKRVWQHKNHAVPGFTKRYNCDRLVYFETYTEVDQAIARETQIKGWSRPKKNALVASLNPDWNDLAADWYNDRVIPSRADGEESPASHEERDDTGVIPSRVDGEESPASHEEGDPSTSSG